MPGGHECKGVVQAQQEGDDSMEKQFMNAAELCSMMGVSESKAYDLIRTMNSELQRDGYLTVRGRVPTAYVKKRFFGLGTMELDSN